MATKPDDGPAAPGDDRVRTSEEALEGTLVGHLQAGLARHQAGELDPAVDSYKQVLALESEGWRAVLVG